MYFSGVQNILECFAHPKNTLLVRKTQKIEDLSFSHVKVAKNMVKMALKWPKIAHFSKFDKFTILADFHDLSTKKVMYESFEPESKILGIFLPD